MSTTKLKGVIAAVATPVARRRRARYRARHQARAISARQRLRRAQRARHHRRGDLVLARGAQARDERLRDAGLPLDRLMVGTGAAAVADAVALTRHAAELGFAGALVLPPFYYKGVPDDGLVAYIETIVQATAQKPDPDLPLSFPAAVRPALARRAGSKRLLDKFGSRIVGLKDSSGDMAYAREAAAISKELRRVPLDRSRAARGARRRVCRLHLGHRQPQRRSLPARLGQGRQGGARRRRRPSASCSTASRWSPASRRCSRISTPIRRWRGSSRRSRRSRPPTAPRAIAGYDQVRGKRVA